MTEEIRANTRITGTLRSVDGRGVVRMEGSYDTGIDDLWSALTDAQRLARWIAEVEGDLRLGGAFRATFTSGWEGPGRVDACEPPRYLLVTMTPGREEETVIEAVLVADGDQTRRVEEAPATERRPACPAALTLKLPKVLFTDGDRPLLAVLPDPHACDGGPTPVDLAHRGGHENLLAAGASAREGWRTERPPSSKTRPQKCARCSR